MAHTTQYKENYGIQSCWPETHEDRPYTIKKKYFIDIGANTVASADSLEDIKDMLLNYPSGEIRIYNPTQEERKEELQNSRTLHSHNLGFMR